MDRSDIVGSALQTYISNMFSAVPGHKVLYLDDETSGIISQLLSQSAALAMDVFLITKLGSPHDRSDVGHLNACVFVRPTLENIEKLARELQDAKHQEFFLFFTNRLDDQHLHLLAESDKFEVVRSVYEYYADVFPVNRDVFTLGKDNQLSLYENEMKWDPQDRITFERSVDGIISFLLATKKRPIVRYANSSNICKKLATAVHQRVTTERDLFDWQEPPNAPLLLILDRMQDPITPLLLQWTYQAQLHELLGIQNSRVNMERVDGTSEKEVVFNPFDDENFRRWDTLNYGEVGLEVQRLMKEVGGRAQTGDLSSIEDISRFVEQFPELLRDKASAAKHVTIMTEFGRLNQQRRLLDVSELEQEIACGSSARHVFDQLLEFIRDPNLYDEDKLRLGLIFALRFERDVTRLSKLRTALRDNWRSEGQHRVALVDICSQNWGGAGMRSRETFKVPFLAKVGNFIKPGGMEGAELVVAQHRPLLDHILEAVAKNKLPGQAYPSVSGRLHKQPPGDIIVFMVGGATFEEAVFVRRANEDRQMRRSVVLGSGFIHNSKSFIAEIERVYGRRSAEF